MANFHGKLRKKCVYLLTILLVLAATACSTKTTNNVQNQSDPGSKQQDGNNKTTDSQKQTKLVVYGEWTPGSPAQKFMSGIFKKFEDQNSGITIEEKDLTSQQFNQGFTAAVTANQQIDVVEVNAQFLRNYITKGLLDDITNQWKHYDWRPEVAWNQMKYFSMNEKVYGVPLVMGSTGIYYNKEVFRKYNLDIPKTWTDMEKIAATLKSTGIAPLTYAGAEPWWNPMHFNMIFYQVTKNKGIETNDQFMKGDFSPQVLSNYEKTIQFFYGLQEKGILDKDSQGLKSDQTLKKLEDGKAAMFFSGDWLASSLLQDKKNLDTIGLMKVPVIEEGLKPHNPGSVGTIFSIYSKSKNKEAAMKFLEYMASKEVSEAMSKSGTASGEPLFPGVEGATEYSKWFTENAQSDTVIWLDAIWEQPIIEEFQQGISKVMTGKVSPKEEVDAIVNKYKQLRTEGKTYFK